MSTVRFQRRPRRELPRVPGGELALQSPPELPRTVPGSLLGKLLPVVMIIGMGGMVAVMVTSGGIGSNPTTLMFPVMMAFSMVGMFANQGGKGARAAEINEDRKDYLRYLDQLRVDVERTAEEQRAALEWSHPDPHLLWTLAGTSRMWERRPGDPDFCHIRAGLGSQRLATRLVAPETGPVEELEPIAAVSLRRFVRAHSVVPDLPTAIAIRGFPAIAFDGDKNELRATLRAMVAQMCTFHGPDHLLVSVVCGHEVAHEWDWVKWLPHTQHPGAKDGVGAGRMVYGSMLEFYSAMRDVLGVRNKFSRGAPAQAGVPQLILVIDGGLLETGEGDPLRDGGVDSVTVLDLSGFTARLAGGRGLRMVLQGDTLGARSGTGVEPFARIDRLSVNEAQTAARRLAPFRTPVLRSGELEEVASGDGPTTWSQLINVGDIGIFNPDAQWKPRYGRERLRVAFGWTADGGPIELDIKESAENGMGPHGLCIGATGSGKSEFLRTLVLGMMATHSPDQLNLVLVDFKGGATFLGFDSAPHVAAVITNLEEETVLVDRMKDALAGEMNRRQEHLRDSGNFVNVSEYEKARAQGADLEPMPALFVVLDEFSELLTHHPDFAELFVAIGRLGRSLHVHLLLASQRLDEGRMRGLETHLSYRIGLKTFSANESRAVLGVHDAYHLPATPGAGYLKADAEGIQRFQAAYVSGKYAGGVTRKELEAGAAEARPERVDTASRLFTAGAQQFQPQDYTEVPATVDYEQDDEPDDAKAVSNVEMLVSRIKGRGRPAHEIWLPPLDEAPTLDQLVPRNILTGEIAPVAGLRAALGLIDMPYHQRRDAYMIELHGGAGNAAIVGGPQSGKSTALRTLILSLALTHTPEQVQFYCLDFGGGTLAGLAGLAHVGGVAGRRDVDAVRRSVAEVTTVLRNREISFRDAGIDSMAQFRQLRATDANSSAAAAAAHQDPYGDVFLIVDGYGSIRQDFDELEQQIMNLAVQGLSYGVHVVISLARWGEARPALKDAIGTRIELRLGDPSDSEMGRKVGSKVPEGRPGRGMFWDGKDGLHTLTGLPRVDGDSDPASLPQGVADAVARINAASAGRRPAPRVRMLPEQYTRDELLAASPQWVQAAALDQPMLQIPIGLNEADLGTVYLDFAQNPHFLIFGDTECGKTSLLRTIVDGITSSNTPHQAMIVLVDFRRTMLGVVPEDQTAAYATNSQLLPKQAGALATLLGQRVPGPDVTAQQLRERSWWSGPDIFVVVDDYDLVATQGSNNPLLPLLDYIAQGKDVGLHVIIARRAGGAGRAMFDPIIGRIKDVASPGLIMSGPRDEGTLLGNVRPSQLPVGRGTLVSRTGTGLIQVPWMPPL